MKLIFVYNADGAFASLAKDIAYKLVAPTKNQCNLCRLTYPVALMDKEWKKFIESLSYEVEFLHRDEFRKQYPDQKDVPLPAVFAQKATVLRVLIPREEINKAQSVKDLMSIVQKALSPNI